MTWKAAAIFIVVPTAFAAASIWWMSGMVCVVAGLLVGWCLLFVGASAGEKARRIGGARSSIFVATAAGVALVASVVVYSWPLRVAFALSRPALERVAADIRNGRPAHEPVWAGLFRVKQADIYFNGIPCLWVDTNAAGRRGFATCGPIDPPFNLQWHVALDERWQWVEED